MQASLHLCTHTHVLQLRRSLESGCARVRKTVPCVQSAKCFVCDIITGKEKKIVYDTTVSSGLKVARPTMAVWKLTATCLEGNSSL